MARDHRRLAAIVSADVVGYSLLMGRDDSATLAGLKSHRRELIDLKIAEYNGRIVKTTGDGLLLEFPSVVDAVRCAVDVQRGMAERNADVPADRRIELRIGINVGDIIIDEEDIFGDGVNVAARLQTLAEPGGICVSRVVRDQVLDKLSFAFEDLGAQEVKNIARPVEVYRVALGADAPPTRDSGRSSWRRLMRGPRKWVAAGVAALGLVAIVAWTLPQLWKAAAPAPAPPDRSIAVLPFMAASGNPADERFAEALTNDLTMAMSRPRIGPVVSQGLAAAYKGKAIDARVVGRDLNVRYLLQGDVRHAGEKIIVNVQAIDTGSATQLWSDQLEVGPTQVGPDMPGFVALLARRLRGALIEEEYRRAAAPLRPGATAMDVAMHAHATYLNDTCTLAADCVRAMLQTRTMLDQALKLDPTLVFALSAKADVLDDQLQMDLRADHDRLVEELDDVTSRAVAADREDASVWSVRAVALAWQWRWPAALEATTRWSNLNPSSAYPFLQRASILRYSGRAGEALTWLDRALAVDPPGQGQELTRKILAERCGTYMVLGRYDEAIADCEKSAALNDYWRKHAHLVAAYAQKGDTARAEAAKKLLLKAQPTITIAGLKGMRLSNDPTYLQQTETHFYAGLRKAGIPEK